MGRQRRPPLFHAGVISGSQYDWKDEANRLHFYIVDVKRSSAGILSYMVGVRSLDGAGPLQRGAVATIRGDRLELRHTGTGWDIYRLSASIEGTGWNVQLQNALAAMPAKWTSSIPLHLTRGSGPATLTVTAISESDPTKKVVATSRLR